MVGRSRITADDGERAALRRLARSSHRAEADHARAVLLTLEERCAAEIAAALGVHVSTVREWRGLFAKGGVATRKRRQPPGRPNRIGTARRPQPWPRRSWPRTSTMTVAGPCQGFGSRSSAAAAQPSRTAGSRSRCGKGVQLAPATAYAEEPSGRRGCRRQPPPTGRAEAAGHHRRA